METIITIIMAIMVVIALGGVAILSDKVTKLKKERKVDYRYLNTKIYDNISTLHNRIDIIATQTTKKFNLMDIKKYKKLVGKEVVIDSHTIKKTGKLLDVYMENEFMMAHLEGLGCIKVHSIELYTK